MYKLNDERMFCDISDNTAIIIDSVVGTYYGLNYFSTEILQIVTNGTAIDSIISLLKIIPNCPEDIENLLNNFIIDLLNKSIIVEDVFEDSKSHEFNQDAAIADDFKFLIDEFADFKEIMFADVIINDLPSFTS